MRRSTRITYALLCIPLWAGCSDGSDPAVDRTHERSPSVSVSSSQSDSPTAEPASGPVIDQESATVNAPAGWKVIAREYPHTLSAEDKNSQQTQDLTVIDLVTGGGLSLAEQVRLAKDDVPGTTLKRLPDVVLDGSPAYHLTGKDSFGYYDQIGTNAHGRDMSLTFTLNDLSAAERREIVDSVIASFQWKK